MVDHGHEQFGEGWGHCNAAVVVHIRGVACSLVDGGDLGVAPVLGGQLGDGTVVEEVRQGVSGPLGEVLKKL